MVQTRRMRRERLIAIAQETPGEPQDANIVNNDQNSNNNNINSSNNMDKIIIRIIMLI